MSEPTDNSAIDTAADNQNIENVEEKSLAFSSMDTTKTEDDIKKEGDEAVVEEMATEEGAEDNVDYTQIKAPDGFELDKDIMAQVAPVFKDLKCSKENAEKIVAAGAEIFNKAIKGQADAYAQKVKSWEEEVKADEVLGKEENIAIANRAVIEFGNERLTKEIIEAGLGNHPAFVRFCYSVGKAIGEDHVITATGSAKASNRNDLGEPMLNFKGM